MAILRSSPKGALQVKDEKMKAQKRNHDNLQESSNAELRSANNKHGNSEPKSASLYKDLESGKLSNKELCNETSNGELEKEERSIEITKLNGVLSEIRDQLETRSNEVRDLATSMTFVQTGNRQLKQVSEKVAATEKSVSVLQSQQVGKEAQFSKKYNKLERDEKNSSVLEQSNAAVDKQLQSKILPNFLVRESYLIRLLDLRRCASFGVYFNCDVL